jgi:arylsulfatase A-like enzyme
MHRPRTGVGRRRALVSPALLATLLAWLGVASCSPASPVEPREKPNIVMIVMDTAAAGHLSLYGHPRPTTPNLERIAANGAVFQNAFSTSTWTLPSHASMFTGLPPSSHSVTTDNLVLDPSITTLAAILSDSGYRTLAFSNNSWVGPNTGLHRGFDRFVNLIWREDQPDYVVHVARRDADGYAQSSRRVPKERGIHDAGAATTNARIRQVLTNRASKSSGAEDAQPLFLFVNYIEPHNPYEPPAELAPPFLPALATLEEARAVPCDPAASDIGNLNLNEQQFALLAGLYDAEINITCRSRTCSQPA